MITLIGFILISLAFMRIFYALNITSRVGISKVVLKIQPYNKNWDMMGLLSDAMAREYIPLAVKAQNKGGVLEIVAPTSKPESQFTEWNKLLSYLAYKLDLPINMPHACPLFTDFKYKRTFSLYLVDRYGRYSNVVQRKLKIITCKLDFIYVFTCSDFILS